MSQPLRVLLVEDSEDDALLLLRLLRNGGYEPETRRVETQPDMRAALTEAEWDIIISDYSMPGFDGLTALKLYHEANLDIPFILVSGTIGEEIAVEAMRAGAHDYLMKDNLARLVPAIQRELHEAQIRHAHRQAQEALQANEKKYRLLVEHAPSGIYEFDFTDARFISVNEVMCEYTGYTNEEFLNLNPLELLTEDSQQLFLARQAQEQEEGIIPELVEYKIRGKNGKEFWVNLQTRMTREDDKLIALVVAHDITERKLAEESLRRYAERLSTLHEIDQAILAAQTMEEIAQAAIDRIRQLVPCIAASVVLLESDSLDVLLFVTASGQQIGIQPGVKFALERYQDVDMLLGTLSQGEVLLIEDLPALADEWPQLSGVIALGMRFVLLVPLLFQDDLLGFIGLGSAERTAFREEQVEITREIANQLAIAIQQAELYDRIARHNAELEQRVRERTMQLEAANEELRILSRVKDEFVSNVSHELRTPITNLKLRHHLLAARPDRWEGHVAVMSRETQRLEQIIESLLYLSRLDQDRVDWNPTLVNLNHLVSQFVRDRTMLAQSGELCLSFTGEPDLPFVEADVALWEQALSILLTNAFNYTPAGGLVEVRTQVREREGQRWVGVSVSDTGPGISPDEQPHLFERFFRGTVGRESGTPGTGLGLSIVQGIVNKHRGQVEVFSEGVPGKGATFSLWLLAADDPAGKTARGG